MMPFVRLSNALVARDVMAYRDLLVSNGGSDLRANGELGNVAAWVRGLYALVGRCDFWMLRAPQNVGSGSVLYSFHGAEGLLVNGPVWQDHGIDFDGVDDYINLPTNQFGIGNTTFSCLCVFQMLSTSTRQFVFYAGDGNNTASSVALGTTFPQEGPRYHVGTGWGGAVNLSSVNLGRHFLRLTHEGLTNTGQLDKANPVTAATANLFSAPRNNLVTIGRMATPGINYLTGNVSFLLNLLGRALTRTDHEQLMDLYKSTLGRGLGLP